MKILQFYYDCLDKFVSKKNFQLIQMDTDSLYMAITGLKFDDIIKPEMKKQFELEKDKWFDKNVVEITDVKRKNIKSARKIMISVHLACLRLNEKVPQ